MSYDLIVYLKRDGFPSWQIWRSAICVAGFGVDLATEFDPLTFSGFLPCSIDGRSCGFEYYVSYLSPDDAYDLVGDGDVDVSVQFRVGSRSDELRTALAASSNLAALSKGVLYDPQLGDSIAGARAVNWARNLAYE